MKRSLPWTKTKGVFYALDVEKKLWKQRRISAGKSEMSEGGRVEKSIALDIDEGHLLLLGHGEEALETEKDFSR